MSFAIKDGKQLSLPPVTTRLAFTESGLLLNESDEGGKVTVWGEVNLFPLRSREVNLSL